MFKLLSSTLRAGLGSVVLFLIIFFLINISNNIMNFHSHPVEYKILLTLIFFLSSVLLIFVTYKIAKKMIYEQINEREVKAVNEKFVSTINYALRAPLTSLLGALNIISSNLVGEIPEPMKEMINVANNNAKKLLEVVDRMINEKKFQTEVPDK